MSSNQSNLTIRFLRRFGLLGSLFTLGVSAFVGIVGVVLLRSLLGDVGGTLLGVGVVFALFMVIATLQNDPDTCSACD